MQGVNVETIHRPAHYTRDELELACRVAYALKSEKLVLCVPPTSK